MRLLRFILLISYCNHLITASKVIRQTTDSSARANKTIKVRLVSWIYNIPYYYERNYQRHLPLTARGMTMMMVYRRYFILCKDHFPTVHDNRAYHFKKHDQLINLITNQNTSYIKQRLNISEDSQEFVIVSASTYSQTNKINKMFTVRLLAKSIGVGILMRNEDITLIKKFFVGMEKCVGITWFSMLGAIIFATIIWLIEHHHGNPNFPQTFGQGLWTSFWYCWVTMTTVGYGDKVPKHYVSRIISVVWMWLGLMLTAVITSTVMDAMLNEVPKVGLPVGILNNTAEQLFVRGKLSAKPIAYETHQEIIEALRRKEIIAAMLDITSAAVLVDDENMSDISIETFIKIDINVHGFVYTPPYYKERCALDDIDDFDEFLMQHQAKVRAMYQPSYNVVPYKVQSITELYTMTNDNMVLYLTSCAGFIVVVAFISELMRCLNSANVTKKSNVKTEFEQLTEYKQIKLLEGQFHQIMEGMLKKAEHQQFNGIDIIKNRNTDM